MTNLCQYKGLSCFGCCGHTWSSRKEVYAQISKNTMLYSFSTLDEFRARGEDKLSCSGGCKSLIKKNGMIVCALHPLQNDGKDYRDKHCNKNYLCKTFKSFLEWDEGKRKRFLALIESKKLDHYSYSMGMDSDKFLKEFEKMESKSP